MSQRLAALGAGAILTALAVAASAPAAAARTGHDGRHAGLAYQPHGPAQAPDRVDAGSQQPVHQGAARLGPPGRQRLPRPDPPGAEAVDIDAVVSPDGRWVLFERDLPTGRSVLGRSAPVGERTSSPCPARIPARGWETPAGRRTAAASSSPGSWGLSRPAGRPTQPCCTPPGRTAAGCGLSQRGIEPVYEDYHARFDASGKYLIFLRLRNRDGKTAVFRMRCDGAQIRQLTPWRLAADVPDLSLATRGPTRNLVVFETFGQGPPQGREQDIATVPATCYPLAACARKIRYVTHNSAGPQTSFNPSWSPDGQRIAFTQALFASGQPQAGEIWTIGPDGHGPQQVSRSPRFDFRPDWGR